MKIGMGRAALLLMAASMLSSCGGSGGGSGSGGTGTLSLSMTDASSDQFESVYVTINEIQIHLGGSEGSPNHWRTLEMARTPITVDLLKLTNGVREQLGVAELPAGDYTQLRLIIGDTPEDPGLPHANYVVDKSTPPNIHELKVPSGTQTGFKIVENFTISDQQTLELVLDFDACKSVIQAGNSGMWLLKPTVKIVDLEEASIVRGKVITDGTNPVPGAQVSAQQYNGSAADAKDMVLVQTSTIADSEGNYALFLKPGSYNIVATAEGKTPDFLRITTAAGQTATDIDFQLGEPIGGSGQVTGTVAITGAGTENYATLSFRQEAIINSNAEMIEVKSINMGNGGTYTISLPVGDYTLVASSLGYATQSIALPVALEDPEVPTDADVIF